METPDLLEPSRAVRSDALQAKPGSGDGKIVANNGQMARRFRELTGRPKMQNGDFRPFGALSRRPERCVASKARQRRREDRRQQRPNGAAVGGQRLFAV